MTDRKTRNELDTLSKDVFGSSSRWQKLVTKGYTEQVTEEVTETVPSDKEGEPPTTKQVSVPVKTAFGAFQSVTKYHTIESVKEFLLEQKAKLDSIRAQIAKQREEALAKQKAEEDAKKLHEENSGSART